MLNDSPAAGRLPHAAQHWYDCMARLDFLPNPPTVMNAGRGLQQLSACFGLPVEDSLTSIYDSLKHQDSPTNQAATLNSRLVTYAFTTAGPSRVVKPRGLRTHFLHPPFQPLDRHHLARRDQRGANMDILRIDYSDILDFIALKQMPTEMTNFKLSVGVTDSFIQALAYRHTYALISPHTNNRLGGSRHNSYSIGSLKQLGPAASQASSF